MQLMVRAPNTGQMMTVIIPQGVGPGGQFAVPLPQPPRVQYGAPQRNWRTAMYRSFAPLIGLRRRVQFPRPRRPSFRPPLPPSLLLRRTCWVFSTPSTPGVRTALSASTLSLPGAAESPFGAAGWTHTDTVCGRI